VTKIPASSTFIFPTLVRWNDLSTVHVMTFLHEHCEYTCMHECVSSFNVNVWLGLGGLMSATLFWTLRKLRAGTSEDLKI
jgi:hypothetical protein